MELPVIEHSSPPPKGSKYKPLFDFILAHLEELGPDDTIFCEEHDKSEKRTMYFALKRFADRRSLPMIIKFYDDGLRVRKLSK